MSRKQTEFDFTFSIILYTIFKSTKKKYKVKTSILKRFKTIFTTVAFLNHSLYLPPGFFVLISMDRL